VAQDPVTGPPPNTSDDHRFGITNRCAQRIRVSVSQQPDRELEPGKSLELILPRAYASARLWAIPCAAPGNCRDQFSTVRTLLEFKFDGSADWIDGSLVDGFNLPMRVSAREMQGESRRCTMPDGDISCAADLLSLCRNDPACQPAVHAAGTDAVVENLDRDQRGTATQKLFFERCPDFSSFSGDASSPDRTGLPAVPGPVFWCPGGTDYDVVFCP
jgi:hypothetical protein